MTEAILALLALATAVVAALAWAERDARVPGGPRAYGCARCGRGTARSPRGVRLSTALVRVGPGRYVHKDSRVCLIVARMTR